MNNFNGGQVKVAASVAVAGVVALGWYWFHHRPRQSLKEVSFKYLGAALNGDTHALKSIGDSLSPSDVAKFRDSKHGCGALLLAVQSGNVKAVEYLVEVIGVDLFDENTKGMNCVHLAAMHGDGDILGYLCTALGEEGLKRLVSARISENGWQVHHVVSVYGYTSALEVLLARCSKFIDWESKDGHGNTALVLAAWNGHDQIIETLLNAGASLSHMNGQGQSALYIASRNGRDSAVRTLLEWASKRDGDDLKAALCQMDRAGYSPLHAACIGGSATVVRLLIQHGAILDARANDGTTAIHMCARMNKPECAALLLSSGVDLGLCSTFGASPLHEACVNGNVAMVSTILDNKNGRKLVESQDYDGLYPLHAACNASYNENIDSECILKIVEMLMFCRSDPNAKDYSNATPLYCMCWEPKRRVVIDIVTLLLRHGADPSIESDQGWGPLHVLHNSTGEIFDELRALLTSNLEVSNPEYLKVFDPRKRRDVSNRSFSARRGPHNRIPIEQRLNVFKGDLSLEAVAGKILRGDAKKIVVMSGAGISCNAGLPDYRGSSGIYTKQGHSSAFDIGAFMERPSDFFDCMEKVFLPVVEGRVKPTKTHCFIKMLQDKGLLLRQYTQNVDMLERAVGVHEELLVESHGTLSKGFCMNTQCRRPIDSEAEMRKVFWDRVRSKETPSCPDCGSIVRPDIVFFGESLPPRFHELLKGDCEKCDMLIIMGTSLVVYPFASIANTVPLLTPRVLFNKESVGPFKNCDSEENYRDVAVIGDCDESIDHMARICGWDKELTELFEKGSTPVTSLTPINVDTDSPSSVGSAQSGPGGQRKKANRRKKK